MTIRIAYASDLHLEFEARGPDKPTREWLDLAKLRKATPGHPLVGPSLLPLREARPDLLVLAGDIGLGTRGITYADQVSQFLGTPVVYVAGNHEFYGRRDIAMLLPELHQAAAATEGRVTFLENEATQFDFPGGRLHVLGCTLWSDYALNGDGDGDDMSIVFAIRAARNGLNDHQGAILKGGTNFTPEMALEMHRASLASLDGEVTRIRKEDQDARILVITHHAPIPEANPQQFRGGELAPAFVSDLRPQIARWRPAAWIWGHTHFSVRTQLGGTLLASAQRGYIGYEEPGASAFPVAIEDLP